jgi:hypothetical protein
VSDNTASLHVYLFLGQVRPAASYKLAGIVITDSNILEYGDSITVGCLTAVGCGTLLRN